MLITWYTISIEDGIKCAIAIFRAKNRLSSYIYTYLGSFEGNLRKYCGSLSLCNCICDQAVSESVAQGSMVGTGKQGVKTENGV
jgi:hypothetical protein